MRTPQIPAMPGMSPLGFNRPLLPSEKPRDENYRLIPLPSRNVDEKTVAERKWRSPLKPQAEQKACDVGLFSDDSKQTELFK